MKSTSGPAACAATSAAGCASPGRLCWRRGATSSAMRRAPTATVRACVPSPSGGDRGPTCVRSLLRAMPRASVCPRG
eukprot:834879-Alexandrium_andersonii.AAC.1